MENAPSEVAAAAAARIDGLRPFLRMEAPMPCIMGIDSGLTVTKAVIFDADGTVLAIARRRVPQLIPAPQHVERDMDGLWACLLYTSPSPRD